MDTSALFRQFVSFVSAVHQVTNDMTKDAKAETITPAQYGILEYIAVNQPVTLSQISDCRQMSMPNTSRELRKLIGKGLCEKFAAADDRRKQYIRLSEDGETLMNASFRQIEARFRERIRELSGSELEEIADALQMLQAKVFNVN